MKYLPRSGKSSIFFSMEASAKKEDLYAAHVFHRTDPARVRRRLDAFYGQVAGDQNGAIAERIHGKRVLDVGAGFGTLTSFLRNRGFDVTGIDLDPDCIRFAHEKYGVELLERSVYESKFGAKEFDTVILREVVFHLDFERALAEIKRICRRRVIIFQGNNSPGRALGQKLFGHREYNERNRPYYVRQLEKEGFTVNEIHFRDLVAFPLSGGLIGRPLLPHRPWLGDFLMKIDRALTASIRPFGLDRLLCFRFILVGDLS